MNDLPSSVSGNTSPPVPVSTGSVSKEVEIGGRPSVEGPFRPAGHEVELSPEVVASGVATRPTAIPIPPPVSQLGVQPAGQNVPAPTPSVTLPLSDDQIALGLKQSIWTSWRWLAQWCVRKLKQVHMGLKNVHGKLTRVRE